MRNVVIAASTMRDEVVDDPDRLPSVVEELRGCNPLANGTVPDTF